MTAGGRFSGGGTQVRLPAVAGRGSSAAIGRRRKRALCADRKGARKVGWRARSWSVARKRIRWCVSRHAAGHRKSFEILALSHCCHWRQSSLARHCSLGTAHGAFLTELSRGGLSLRSGPLSSLVLKSAQSSGPSHDTGHGTRALQSALQLYSSTALYTLHPLHPPSGCATASTTLTYFLPSFLSLLIKSLCGGGVRAVLPPLPCVRVFFSSLRL